MATHSKTSWTKLLPVIGSLLSPIGMGAPPPHKVSPEGFPSSIKEPFAPPRIGPQQPSPSMQEPPPLTQPIRPTAPEPTIPRYSQPRIVPDSEKPLEDVGSHGLPSGSSIRIQESQGIRYVSGGIGAMERAELGALSPQFNLWLQFVAQGSGHYLADVAVTIVDSRGNTVLRTLAQGPWFLAQLPPGIYTLHAETLGRMQTQRVPLGTARQIRINFYWSDH